MIKIYIASPYSQGNQADNVRRQIDAANELMNAGFCPFVPLLSHFQHLVHPRSYEDWLKFDNEWVLVCDALLRLPGESKGADMEVDLALSHDIPVFFSVDHLILVYQSREAGISSHISTTSASETVWRGGSSTGGSFVHKKQQFMDTEHLPKEA